MLTQEQTSVGDDSTIELLIEQWFEAREREPAHAAG
jgi:hypothetical protein